MNHSELYNSYVESMRRIADVKFSIALLSWDQETYQPKGGAEIRSQQIGTLSGIAHDKFVDKKLGDILQKLSHADSLTAEQSKNVNETLKDYTREKKYPTEFVERMAQVTSKTFQAWLKSREENKFSVFQPMLEEMIKLKREEVEILGYKDHPYNALLNLYEPGAKTSELSVLFNEVKKNLVEYVKEISSRKQVRADFLRRYYPKDKQWNFGMELLKQMGFDFDRGRQDISAHPFTTSFSMQDVRVTTRINENDFGSMPWSCIHEGGHALYEQGLKPENYGLPAGEAISLGIHESQSRLWENLVGRSQGYWAANFPLLKKYFSENLSDVTVEEFYRSINCVKPSLIRVEADELTYHFHIMIRFEIEKGLMDGSIAVKDLPSVWNQKYKEYMNVDVPSDKEGVLQDIHWSHGSMGYFPTYSLGSFYAVQFFNQAKKEMPSLLSDIEKGQLLPLREWLRKNIHQYGRLFSATELCEKVTGEKLSFKHFMKYAKEKYDMIYSS